MPERQVKSKQRVADYGEVFTAKREVNAMLDLVKPETQRIESRFLEPACGEGAFLTEILCRKLSVVKRKYGKSPIDYEKYSILAVSSIYGVDIMEDNVLVCRQNLFEIWHHEYSSNMMPQLDDRCCEIVRFILEKNIICGDALTLLKSDGSSIVFSEWNLVTGDKIKRRDFALDELLSGHDTQPSLFMGGWEFDEETNAYIPAPIKDYPIVDYRSIDRYE